MWLWISVAVAVAGGLISPFGERLQAVGLWAGKALVPPEAEASLPRGVQDALTDGWPSTVGFVGSFAPFGAGLVGFFHAWWMGVAAFFIAFIVSAVAGQTRIASPYLERYLVLLLGHAQRRMAGFEAEGDQERMDLTADLVSQLEELVELYGGTRVPVPTINQAREAPHGDKRFLLRKHAQVDVPS